VLKAAMLALGSVLVVVLLRPPRVHARALPSVRVPTWRPGRAGARRAAELEWVESVVAELRAGADPVGALVAAESAAPRPVAPGAAVAVRSGADVAVALERDAGSSALMRGVAACWSVAQGSGAGLAAALLSLADSARAAEAVRRELHAGLAEPRATALVLAALPLVGLAMGVALGADPLAWLLGTTAGNAVLALGMALECLGAWWAWRIAARLEAEL
jgi:tight adherence protein B